MVAATDCPNKFKSIGDKFAQLLFSCRVGRCIGCDHLELSVPGDDEANRGRGTTGDGGGGTAVDEDYEVGGSKESKDDKFIDSPESKMSYGKEAHDELLNMVEGKCLKMLVYTEDRYGRRVGDIYCNGKFVQEVMLKKGLVWHYVAYDKCICMSPY
ncbi:hypothetical protein ARALYDRAFT_909137 [Arabidopsis lyrata subsp. lyrata]|uniref:TNase-like domain-containing protein n=1 Tax=Arabidopsis lyrata subsp. lyrata TaxID=81972 RepID=D7M4B6_ARALL|nr:hypothetical protein ARALYDRAFT_909137 [Arabidopsis lyrata subsp. lyrata]